MNDPDPSLGDYRCRFVGVPGRDNVVELLVQAPSIESASAQGVAALLRETGLTLAEVQDVEVTVEESPFPPGFRPTTTL